MAGGPNARLAPCFTCGGPAERTSDGLETDHYTCPDCGSRFGITFDEDAGGQGPPGEPLYRPSLHAVPNVSLNAARRTISCRIAYCGPAMAGKTTNLEGIRLGNEGRSGELTAVGSGADRLLLLEVQPDRTVLGTQPKFEVVTVPGATHAPGARNQALEGAGAVVFVADSQVARMDENLDVLRELQSGAAEFGLKLDEIPLIFQWNKRDLPDIHEVIQMWRQLNPTGPLGIEAVAKEGRGVLPTFRAITGEVLRRIERSFGT